MLRADVCGRDQRQFDEIHAINATIILGHDAGLRGLRDARRRHDPTRPLRHRDLRFLSASRNHAMFEPSPDRFPCSTGASAPRPRPARTRTASSRCRSKRSASSDTTRACPYLLSISLARAARRGFFLLMYICVHLSRTRRLSVLREGEVSPLQAEGRGAQTPDLRRAARPGPSRRVDGTASLGSPPRLR